MFGRLSKSWGALLGTIPKNMSTRPNGTGEPIYFSNHPLFGPFVLELEENELANVVNKVQITPLSTHIEAYSPLLEQFNADVVKTLGLLSGDCTKHNIFSKIVFYTKSLPIVINDQTLGDIVGFKAVPLPIEIAMTSSYGKVVVHNQTLFSAIKSKLSKTFETLSEPRKQLYKDALERNTAHTPDDKQLSY